MRKLFRIFLLIVFCGTAVKCDRCIGTGFSDCADSFSFRIVSKSTQEDLVFGPSPRYNRYSVFLFTTLSSVSGRFSSNDSIKFTSFLSTPVDTLYLYLNSADTDTLLMMYNYEKEPCCRTKPGHGKIVNIEYNGVIAIKQGDIFLFEK